MNDCIAAEIECRVRQALAEPGPAGENREPQGPLHATWLRAVECDEELAAEQVAAGGARSTPVPPAPSAIGR